MKEETGLVINVISLLAKSIRKRNKTEYRVGWYLCYSNSRNQVIVPGGDLIEASFVPKKDVFTICDSKTSSLWPPEIILYLTQQVE
jgi:hypothetical protein